MVALKKKNCTFPRYLKPENLFIRKKNSISPEVVLADLGSFNKVSFQNDQKTKETIFWMAPEQVNDSENSSNLEITNKKSCVFTVALIALYLIDKSGFEGFKDEMGRNILNKCESTLRGFLKSLKKSVPPTLFVLLQNMLSFDYSRRQSLEYLVGRFELISSKKNCFSKLLAE